MRLRKRLLLLPLFAMLGCSGGDWNSGDRVLVAKCLYETKIKQPERFDVVVFKYPQEPVKRNVPTNYIKRLLGLPGEIIAIFFGQIFRMPTDPAVPVPSSREGEANALELWQTSNQPRGEAFDRLILDGFEKGKFEIVRKPPAVMMTMRRIVYDNNYQAADLKMLAPRWDPRTGSGWTASGDRRSFTFVAKEKGDIDWLSYQHIIRPEGPIVGNARIKPRLITDFMGYNGYNLHDKHIRDGFYVNWAGNLMLEANVTVRDSGGEFWMELNKGINRFQARWDIASGSCTLFRVGEDGKSQELGSTPTSLRGAGSYQVRFSNFDSRLTVWVGRDLPFGDGVAYDPVEMPPKGETLAFEQLRNRFGPRPNDLERPASLGGKGVGLGVSDVRLWRDTYYTMKIFSDVSKLQNPDALSDPSAWEDFRNLQPAALYVYPGHFLCLGDNSTHSSDGREWGLVPERLMLGRALAVYYPLHRAGLIR